MIAVMATAIAFLIFLPKTGELSTQSTNSDNKSKSMADNMSRFYENFKQISRDPIKEKYGDFVVPLDNQDEPLHDAIVNATQKNYPPMDNWQGDHKERPFAPGTTIKTEAAHFVAKEGFTLVWDLNQDFIVKDRFISTNSLVGMLEDISGAIDANFDKPILIYFCFKKRVLVITERESEYLKNNCQKSDAAYDQYY